MNQVIAAFYKFVALQDYQDRREPLLNLCQQYQIKGTILLAAEGINGTIAGTRSSIEAIFAHLRADSCFADLEYKESTATKAPFDRLKVRLRPEIVTLGIPTVDPSNLVGTYVKPQDWNELIANPEVMVIDTRNYYEVEVGTFGGSIPIPIHLPNFPNMSPRILIRNNTNKSPCFAPVASAAKKPLRTCFLKGLSMSIISKVAFSNISKKSLLKTANGRVNALFLMSA
jgi:predicted sulfurtransferase